MISCNSDSKGYIVWNSWYFTLFILLYLGLQTTRRDYGLRRKKLTGNWQLLGFWIWDHLDIGPGLGYNGTAPPPLTRIKCQSPSSRRLVAGAGPPYSTNRGIPSASVIFIEYSFLETGTTTSKNDLRFALLGSHEGRPQVRSSWPRISLLPSCLFCPPPSATLTLANSRAAGPRSSSSSCWATEPTQRTSS